MTTNLPNVDEALKEYFKLKQKYEEKISLNKKKILNNSTLSKREKRFEFLKLKPKCINCQRPGGTIFKINHFSETDKEEAHRQYSASCGIVVEPCNLNIKIQLGVIELLPELLDKTQQKIKEFKNYVIDDKNKLLFGYLTTENVLERFDFLKETISHYTSLYEIYFEHYNNLVDNNKKNEQLNEAITKSYIQIEQINNCIQSMKETNNVQYAKDAVNIYENILIPLLHEIRSLKYNETMVTHDDKLNTCYLIQLKHSISNLSYANFENNVVAFDVGLKIQPTEKISKKTKENNNKKNNNKENKDGMVSELVWDCQNNSEPFVNILPAFDLTKNNTVRFKITIPNNSPGWVFDICPSNDKYLTDVRLHFNTQYKKRNRITMTNKLGTWGDALHTSVNPNEDEDEMTVTVQIIDIGFLIFINNIFTTFFPHRTNVATLQGDLKIVFMPCKKEKLYQYTIYDIWWGHENNLLTDADAEQIQLIINKNASLNTTLIPQEPRTLFIEGIPETNDLEVLQTVEYSLIQILEDLQLSPVVSLIPNSTFGYIRFDSVEQATLALPELKNLQFDDDELGMHFSFKADWAERYIGKESQIIL